MTAPVDVLAVMDAELSMLDGRGMTARFNEAREARAAVAELLDAAAAIAYPYLTDPQVFNCQPRLRTALARCKGGAA